MMRSGSAIPIGRINAGVALVAVLWVVAALSILVTGFVQTQREETRTASSSRMRQQADATGQGAIHLVVQEMLAQPRAPAQLVRSRISYDGVEVLVELQPLTGLVDLNLAPEPLLAALLSINGGLDAAAAGRIAASVLAIREASSTGPKPRFHAPEELLNVEGLDYDLYAKLAHLVTTDSRGTGRINPLAAPPAVLLLLAAGDQALANRIAADRDADVPGIDTTRLQASFTDTSGSSRLRFRAFVPFPDGTKVIVVRDIDISPAAEGTAPWRTMRTHAPVMSPS